MNRRPCQLQKYLVVLRVSLQSSLTYRADLLGSFLAYSMFIFVFFNLWRAIYSGGGVEGLTFQQMIWYLCITELISFGARSRPDMEISEKVKSGEVAYQLSRPYNFVGYQIAHSLGEISYRLLAFTVLSLSVGMIAVGPIAGFAPWTLPISILSVMLGILLNMEFQISIGLLAFRIEDTFGVNLIYSKLVFMLGTFIPVEFLPGWLQFVAKCLPFSYVSWAPARLTVGFSWSLFGQLVPMQLLWVAALLALDMLLYRNGIKSLQAQGG